MTRHDIPKTLPAGAPEQPLPAFRHPFFIEEDHAPLPTLYDAEGYAVIQFDPVPQQRRRRVGWDEDRQRAFVGMLARIPSVGHAARAVGMSARSAYKLLDRPGAQSFARAWDQALAEGMARLRGASLARCLEGGDFVPVYRRGRLVRIEHRRNDKLAIALLSGQHRDVDAYRRGAQTRWRQRLEWAAADAAAAAELETEARCNERAAAAAEAAARRLPRVRSL
jgi:hypothetical protein